jgi:hypothetical protein
MKINLFRNNYNLTIKPDYCGVISQCKKPKLGEDWLRGSDLRDGKLHRLPFVLWDIFCCELGIGRHSR